MDEKKFQERYPVIYDYLESFWLKVDGANLFEDLYGTVVYAHPDRAVRYGEELRKMSEDPDFTNEELSELFSREGNHPYLVVGTDNAKDVLFCLGQYLDFLLVQMGSNRPPPVPYP